MPNNNRLATETEWGDCGDTTSPHFWSLKELPPEYRLIGAIVNRAYLDIDSDDAFIRGTAIEFFRNPPSYVPDIVINFARKELIKNGKLPKDTKGTD